MRQLRHRTTAAEAHSIGLQLLALLKAAVNETALFDRIRAVLAEDTAPTTEQRQQMRDFVAIVAGLPQQVATLKNLVDAIHKIIGVEPEAFGLNTAAGSDGLPMVIIKDYTGRCDVDAPTRVPALQ